MTVATLIARSQEHSRLADTRLAAADLVGWHAHRIAAIHILIDARNLCTSTADCRLLDPHLPPGLQRDRTRRVRV